MGWNSQAARGRWDKKIQFAAWDWREYLSKEEEHACFSTSLIPPKSTVMQALPE